MNTTETHSGKPLLHVQKNFLISYVFNQSNLCFVDKKVSEYLCVVDLCNVRSLAKEIFCLITYENVVFTSKKVCFLLQVKATD